MFIYVNIHVHIYIHTLSDNQLSGEDSAINSSWKYHMSVQKPYTAVLITERFHAYVTYWVIHTRANAHITQDASLSASCVCMLVHTGRSAWDCELFRYWLMLGPQSEGTHNARRVTQCSKCIKCIHERHVLCVLYVLCVAGLCVLCVLCVGVIFCCQGPSLKVRYTGVLQTVISAICTEEGWDRLFIFLCDMLLKWIVRDRHCDRDRDGFVSPSTL